MLAFDFVVLGCGGGPSEYNLSGYLLKPHDIPWSEGTMALEAGSGFGALKDILRDRPDLFGSREVEDTKGDAIPFTPLEVYSWIQCYLITHAHLDHVNSLVLSAGSLAGAARRLYATHQTLKDIEGIFSDRLWPNLASWDPKDDNAALIYTELHVDGLYKDVLDHISVCTMPLSHGKDHSGDGYDSAAFFIRHNPSNHELLFFGDVEPDSLAAHPRTLDVWRAAAKKIPHTLSTIFIECSWPLGRADDILYGHLNPEHLAAELCALASEVIKVRQEAVANGRSSKSHRPRKKQRRGPVSSPSLRGALEGVRVFIIHCKEDLRGTFTKPINQVIADQVRMLLEEQGLGVEIIAAEQGMHIRA